MNILVASGSFKDVYDPIEACEMIKNALNTEKNQVSVQPICDGGEYTYDILKDIMGLEEICVDSVYNAYLKPIKVHYLSDGLEAHIVSSEVIRLLPKEDYHKNPLKLSDYGLGQMVLDAVQRGHQKITLYIGGTSTADGGMGFAQALGVKLYDKKGRELKKPVIGEDLINIEGIKRSDTDYSHICFRVVADGDAKSFEMAGITALKISLMFQDQRELIVRILTQGIEHIQELTGIQPDMAFTGAAGGLRFGIDQVFQAEYILGGSYFSDLFRLEEKLENADLILTGEGRFDNTACGKAPAYVAEMANRFSKPVFFVCGQLAEGAVSDYSGGIICGSLEKTLRDIGVQKMFTCQEYYDKNPLTDSYIDNISTFRKMTPLILKGLFEKEGL